MTAQWKAHATVAPAAVLMSLEGRSYCWIVRRFTPDFSLNSRWVLKVGRLGFATDRPIQSINGTIFGDFVRDRVKPEDFPHGKRLPDVLERPSGVPLETGRDPAGPVFGEQEYSVRAAGFSTGTPDFCRISNASSVPDMPDTYLGTPRSNRKAIPVEIIMDRKLSSST